MKFKLFNHEVILSVTPADETSTSKATAAKISTSLKKIEQGLISMNELKVNYSEYALQKHSKVSINTIKKYRDEIEKMKLSL